MARRKRTKVGVLDGRHAIHIEESESGRWMFDIGRGGDYGCGVGYESKEEATTAALAMAERLQRQIDARWAAMRETIARYNEEGACDDGTVSSDV